MSKVGAVEEVAGSRVALPHRGQGAWLAVRPTSKPSAITARKAGPHLFHLFYQVEIRSQPARRGCSERTTDRQNPIAPASHVRPSAWIVDREWPNSIVPPPEALGPSRKNGSCIYHNIIILSIIVRSRSCRSGATRLAERNEGGTGIKIAQAAKEHPVYYAKHEESGGDYSVDHTSVVYVMDLQGRFAAGINSETPTKEMAAKLTKLLG
ncbi:MAG TPA: SCO family protein [Stellaceae bacterium]|nr:SCO family protein [Stellaceae bacterium]